MKIKKVSIILIHYNQKEFIKEALKSVFNQTYNNIELLIADDASEDFDLKELKKYIEKENKNKIKVKYQVNKENIGTVKNINKALNEITGDYLLLFAADDKLYDKNVISKMVEYYDKQDDDVSIVFGQCLMMDYDLKEVKEEYINLNTAKEFNNMSAHNQFKLLTSNCFAAMGACMLNTKILKDEGKFDERFKYIEDWTYFLKTTLNNHRMKFLNYKCLLHRDGGISHSDGTSEVRIGFVNDLLKQFEIYVFPHFKELNNEEKNKALIFYNNNRDYLINNNCSYNDKEYKKLQKSNFVFFMLKKLKNNNLDFRKKTKKHIRIIETLSIITILLILLDEHFNNKYDVVFNYGIYLLLILIALLVLKTILLLILKVISKVIR